MRRPHLPDGVQQRHLDLIGLFLIRVFSGILRPETTVHVSGHGMEERGHPDHDADERVAHLFSPLGGQLRVTSPAGDGTRLHAEIPCG